MSSITPFKGPSASGPQAVDLQSCLEAARQIPPSALKARQGGTGVAEQARAQKATSCCIHIPIHVHVNLHIFIHTPMHTRGIHRYKQLCIALRMYVCLCVGVCVHVRMYLCTCLTYGCKCRQKAKLDG